MAPIYFIIVISSLRTEIPIVTVLLIKKIDTANRIAMIPTEMYAINALIPVSVEAVISDLFTVLTPSKPSR